MSNQKQPRPDLSENPDGIDEVIERQRLKEKSLHMVKVSHNTWIVVPSRKNNPEYIERYKREKMDVKPVKV